MRSEWLAVVLLSVAGFVLPGAEKARMTPLPQLGRAEMWRSSNPALLPVSGQDGSVVFQLEVTRESSPQRILLKNPLPVPAGSELFFDALLTDIYPTLLHLIAEDSAGNTFRYPTDSFGTIRNGNFLGGVFRGGLWGIGEVRTRVPGMQDQRRGTWEPILRTHAKPLPPLKVLGFELSPEAAKTKHAKLYLRNFRLSDANHKNEPFYYLFKGREFYGTADGDPLLYATDVLHGWGGTYHLDWELRDRYEGQPFLTGSRTWKVDPSSSSIPLRVQLRRDPIRIPVRNEGTYFLRAKMRSSFREGGPSATKELEFRYTVLKGEPPQKHSPIPPSDRIGKSQIRIAYDRPGLIWKPEEPWILRFRVFDGSGMTAVLTVKRQSGKTLLQKEYPVQGTPASFEADLNALPPGAYLAVVELREGRWTRDRLERMIGREFREETAPMRLPPGVPSALEVRDGKRPLALFAPMIHDKARTVYYYTRLMDEMVRAGNTREFEIQTSWPMLEPLPGIYDFSVIDEILDEAAKRGLRAFVTMAPFFTPEWMPAFYTQNAEGKRFGHSVYLFHGGRQNIFQVPYLKERALKFLRAMTLHVRNHPALLGYFYISEHSGEAPWADWYEGFDPWTRRNFRAAAEKQYRTIENANRAWRTAFSSFSALEPPVVGKPASLIFRRDWLLFRRSAIHDFIAECVRSIREADPHRIIMIYGDGLILNRLPELTRYHLISANGGCAVPSRGYAMTIWADVKIPQRAEEITCSFWEGREFPTRLDVSLFNMMAGGGANSHCKMFIGQGARFEEIRKPPQGLERFERFLPIWRELRGAVSACREVAGYADFEGSLTRGQTVNCGGMQFGEWYTLFLMQSQVPFFSNVTEEWKQAKLTVASPSMKLLAEKDCRALLEYARNGGTLFMTADTGRHVIEKEGEDWVLLRMAGFPVPRGELPRSWYASMDAEPGSRWGKSVGKMKTRVRTPFMAPDDCGEVLMRMTDLRKTPALSVKSFGKGKIYVLWLGEYIPLGFQHPESESFLRKMALEAGAGLPLEADNRRVLTHFLRKGEVWYLLAMNDGKKENLRSRIRLSSLPEGRYRIRELIGGKKEDARFTAASLRKEGLVFLLNPRQVVVYRIEKIKEN